MSLLNGVGAGSPVPQGGKGSTELAKNSNDTFGNSIFAQLNDNDNIVDNGDVKYLQGASNGSAIDNFLQQHKGENWTQALKDELGKLVSKFNLENKSRQMQNSDFDEAFKNFGEQAKADFDKTDNDNKNEIQAFKEDANGKVLEFNNQIHQEQKGLVKEGISKILEDLRNGYDGNIVIEGFGTVTYDKEKSCFVIASDRGNKQIPNDKLEQVIEALVDSGMKINGHSRKTENS